MDWESEEQPSGMGSRKKIRIIAIAGVLVLLFIVMRIISCTRGASTSYSKDRDVALDWPQMGLATRLPEPPTEYGEVIGDSSSYFSAYFYHCDEDDFISYVSACKESGFSESPEEAGSSYTAQAEDGCKLSLYYYSDDSEISVSLDAQSEEDTASTDDTTTEDDAKAAIASEDQNAETEISHLAQSAEGMVDKLKSAGSGLLSSLSGSDTTYEEIYNSYSQQIADKTPTLINEFNSEADASDGSIDSLAGICNNKVSDLAELTNEGVSAMAELMYKNGDDYSIYDEWGQKLYSVYTDYAGQIQDVYLSRAV